MSRTAAFALETAVLIAVDSPPILVQDSGALERRLTE